MGKKQGDFLMASRDLNDLSPAMQPLARKHIAECAKQGIDLLIYCTYRPDDEQNAAYACGRTAPGKIITNCRGGQSKHNKKTADGKPASDAYDCVPCVGGKPQWADAKLYLKVGQIAESIGLTWAGRWTGSLKETAHMQLGA